MKILQINTIYKYRSTGRTCFEVEKWFEEKGNVCVTAHQKGYCADKKHSIVVNTWLEYLFHKFMSRMLGLDGYFSYFATKRLIKKIKAFDPDIIHLRNLHGGYLNLNVLFKYLANSNKPVIYNIHDTWAYTGKCPEYSNVQCTKWETACRRCPQWRRYPKSWFFDFSYKMFRDKMRWYSSLNKLIVIGVSNWITDEVRKSALLSSRPAYAICNWINTDVFQPQEKNVLHEKFGEGKYYVLGVSSAWVKNTELDEFRKLSRMLPEEYQIVLVGGEKIDIEDTDILHIPFTNSVEELAELYSSADVFVHLSSAESFGKVIAEAIACGTPAVVYDVTGCSEIVGEGCGKKIKIHALDDVAESIVDICKNGKKYYSAACLENTHENYSMEKQIKKIEKIYIDACESGS